MVKSDDRLAVDGVESREVKLVLPGATGLPIHYRVAYQRVQHLGGGENDAKIAGEIELASADLAP